MTKKLISLLLAAVFVFMLAMPALAADKPQEGPTPIVLHFKSSIGGLISADYEQFADINCDTVDFNTVDRNEPIGVSDYGGTPDYGEIRAGRSYYVYYSFVPVNGYVLPEKLDETNTTITCDKGVRILSYAVTADTSKDNGVDDRTILVTAFIKADGDFMQRLFGRIYDIYLKIRAWSLY